MKYLVQAFCASIFTSCKRKYCAQNIFCVAYHASLQTHKSAQTVWTY